MSCWEKESQSSAIFCRMDFFHSRLIERVRQETLMVVLVVQLQGQLHLCLHPSYLGRTLQLSTLTISPVEDMHYEKRKQQMNFEKERLVLSSSPQRQCSVANERPNSTQDLWITVVATVSRKTSGFMCFILQLCCSTPTESHRRHDRYTQWSGSFSSKSFG